MSDQIKCQCDGTPPVPQLHWSPTAGLIELVDVIGDEAVYRYWAEDRGSQHRDGTPYDAIELVPAPSVEECEQLAAADAVVEAARAWAAAVVPSPFCAPLVDAVERYEIALEAVDGDGGTS